jgi:SAM-dependent methyltransferase
VNADRDEHGPGPAGHGENESGSQREARDSGRAGDGTMWETAPEPGSPGGLEMLHYLALRSGVRRGSRVLLAGSDSDAGIYLAEWFGCLVTVAGTDPDRLTAAAAWVADRGLGDRIRFVLVAPRRLDLPSGSLDVAVVPGGLQWLAREADIAAIGRALRPGGRLALTGVVLQRQPDPVDDLPREAGRWQLMTMEECGVRLRRLAFQAHHVESSHFLVGAWYQRARVSLLAGEHDPHWERRCREYDRIGFRYLGWGLVIAEKQAENGVPWERGIKIDPLQPDR